MLGGVSVFARNIKSPFEKMAYLFAFGIRGVRSNALGDQHRLVAGTAVIELETIRMKKVNSIERQYLLSRLRVITLPIR
jgi:hypothetical protein